MCFYQKVCTFSNEIFGLKHIFITECTHFVMKICVSSPNVLFLVTEVAKANI